MTDPAIEVRDAEEAATYTRPIGTLDPTRPSGCSPRLGAERGRANRPGRPTLAPLPAID